MKRNRLIVLGLFILSLVAISFYGGPVSYGFFFFILITPAVSALYSIIVFYRFRIYQKIETKVAVVDTPVAFYYSLQNEERFGFAGVRTGFYTDFSSLSGIDSDTEYELFPHTGIERESQLICKYRGEYYVGVEYVIVQDYLRLFRFTFKNRERITVRVIPKLVILKDPAAFDELSVSPRDIVNKTIEPDVLVRDYFPGDDIRSISWKLTAATGKPMVRKRIGENTPSVSIIMDPHRQSRLPEEFLPLENKLLETTLALAWYYLSRGVSVSVYTYDDGPKCFAMENTDAFEAFYQAMSAFTFREENSAEKLLAYTSCVPEIFRSSAVLFVMHTMEDKCIRLSEELMNNSVSLATFLITEEKVDMPGAVVIGYDDDLSEKLI